MAKSEERNFIFDAGDDETFNLTFDQAITGWTVYFDLKGTDLNKEITNHDDAPNGKTSFTLTDTETNSLNGNHNYEMRYTTDQGNDETFLKGKMTWI